MLCQVFREKKWSRFTHKEALLCTEWNTCRKATNYFKNPSSLHFHIIPVQYKYKEDF